MPLIKNGDIDFQERSPGITLRQMVNEKTGSRAAIVGEVLMAPGTSLDTHNHDVEEAIFILEGNGEGVLGDANSKLEPGDTILAPPGVKHRINNTGAETMRFVFFYPTCNVQTERFTDE